MWIDENNNWAIIYLDKKLSERLLHPIRESFIYSTARNIITEKRASLTSATKNAANWWAQFYLFSKKSTILGLSTP